MIRTINLHDGKTQLVQLSRKDLSIELEKCSHNFEVALDQNRLFSVVISGFATPAVIEFTETAIARVHGDVLDIETSLGISDLISKAIAKTELSGMFAQKRIRVVDLSVGGVEMNLLAEKKLRIDSDSAVARVSLRSLAHAIELDEVKSVAIARSEMGNIYLVRLRVLTDDEEYMMPNDEELALNELYKFDEMG